RPQRDATARTAIPADDVLAKARNALKPRLRSNFTPPQTPNCAPPPSTTTITYQGWAPSFLPRSKKLRRRSQRMRMTRVRFSRIAADFLPTPRILHPCGFQVHAERGQVVLVPQLDLPLIGSPPC